MCYGGALMLSLHPRFVRAQGCRTEVVLSEEEWNCILEELEELEDIRDIDRKCAGIEEFTMCRLLNPCGRKRR